MSTKNIGGSISLEGASKYNSDLKQIKQNLTLLRSEMKVCNSQYASSANSVAALSKKHEIYEKEIEQVAKKVKTYADAIEDSKKKQEEAGNKISNYSERLESAKSKLDALEKSGNATNEELEEQRQVISELEKQLSNANQEYTSSENAIKKYTTAQNNAQAELNKLNTELTQNDKYLDEARNSADGCAKSIDQYGSEIDEAGEKTKDFGSIVSASLKVDAIEAALKTIVNGVKQVAEYSIEAGSSFEAGMDKVAAISGATGEDLERLTEKAKEMGATTMFSATESAEALQYMAMAGWKADQMIAGLPAIMNLAAASGDDLATVSDIVTDDLTAFGLAAEDAGHFADVLAAASSNANTNVSLMGETFKYAGAVAGAMGYDVEDLAVATGLMANAGIKASNAGTALRSVITRMAKPTKESYQAMQDLGISLTDNEGQMYSFMEIMEQMRDGFADLTEAEKAEEAAMLAGKTGMSGLLSIVNASEADFNKLCEAIENCDGAAEEMAATMQDNLKGKVTILQSALEGLGISVYDVFSEDLKGGVEAATEAVERLHDSVENGDIGVSLNKMSDALEDMITAAVDLGEDVLPVLIDAFTWIIDHGGLVAGTIGGILAFKTTMDVATAAVSAFNAVMAANPYVLIAAGIAALTGALIGLSSEIESDEERVKRLNDTAAESVKKYDQINEKLDENIQNRENARKSIESEEAASKKLVSELSELQSKTSLTTEEQARQSAIIEQLNQQYPDLNLAIDEQTGKLNLSTDAILENIDALLQQAKAAAAQEDMANIAKDLYEAEKELADIEKERTDNLNESADASRQAYREMEEYGRVTDETQERVALASEVQENLNEKYNETQEKITSLTGEYETAAEYVAASTEQMAESTEGATDRMGTAFEELEEEAREELDKIKETVSGFSGMFDEMSTEASKSMGEISQNLANNAQSMSDYADNIHKAMNIAAESTDSSTKAIVDYLIGMGVDGAAELAQFVQAAEENSAEYQQVIENFGDFQIAQNTAEQALEDWRLGMNTGYEGIISDAEGFHTDLNDEQEGFHEEQLDNAEQFKDDYTEMATETQQSHAEATLDEKGTVEDAYGEVAQAAIDKSTSTLGIEGGRSSVFYDMGITIDDSLASGIEAGTSAVENAVSSMCQRVVSSVDISGLTSRIDQALADGAERAAAVYGN
ncbi:phage tail tape measure protein [Butyrivibrio sp.]|uniref:phage tail tape measure protein n=1 Tax=Butyrivibrio sp. TaxID=28121 RepID=UPI0025BB215F|nr:phage tail tape measure protein [Butyrivibrio sp.]MBQ9302027.1 phage tail tape measure protein [Butyrivibrio sp.]